MLFNVKHRGRPQAQGLVNHRGPDLPDALADLWLKHRVDTSQAALQIVARQAVAQLVLGARLAERSNGDDQCLHERPREIGVCLRMCNM